MARRKRKPIAKPQIAEGIHLSDLNVESQKSLLRTFAKRANQRLVRLEKAGLNQYAYSNAMAYLLDSGKRRFSESIGTIGKMTDFQRKTELSAIMEFLGAKTSTVGGFKAILKSNAKRLADKGIDIDNDDFFEFLKSDEYKSAKSKLGSEQVMENVDQALSQGVSLDSIIEDFKMYNSGAMTFQDLQKVESTGAYIEGNKRKNYQWDK